jgi:transposase
MGQKILFVGLDVDTKAIHAFLICERDGEFFQFSCETDSSVLIRKLQTYARRGYELRICYEASYIGYSLHRDLISMGLHCDIIAPSLIPQVMGNKVKTDRLDAEKLARFYMKGLLTPIFVPDPETEAVRDLIRTRRFLQEQQIRLKGFITAMCRRLKLNYKEATSNKAYWTTKHLAWLEDRAGQAEPKALSSNFLLLLKQFHQNEAIIADYDAQIELVANEPKYQQKVKALSCYRGIETLTALQLITEIGDIRRFKHPRALSSYAGMDIIERTSGGNVKQYRITGMGNRHIRTGVVDACQLAIRVPSPSRRLKFRRQGAHEQWIEIADRCMRRLHKKGTRMLYRGKPINKIKVACAREMLGFIWESLQTVT